jgi:hypothetical protein
MQSPTRANRNVYGGLSPTRASRDPNADHFATSPTPGTRNSAGHTHRGLVSSLREPATQSSAADLNNSLSARSSGLTSTPRGNAAALRRTQHPASDDVKGAYSETRPRVLVPATAVTRMSTRRAEAELHAAKLLQPDVDRARAALHAAEPTNDQVALELRAKRRERCIRILTESDLTAEVRQHFLELLDESWVTELLELFNDPILPRNHWHEWCFIAMREGKRYPFIVRKLQTRRLEFVASGTSNGDALMSAFA